MKVEFDIIMVDKLYHRANLCSSFRPIVRFVVEIQRFVYDRAIPPIIEKLRSKGVAMHTYGISTYYLEINYVDLGGAVGKECKDRARIEFGR